MTEVCPLAGLPEACKLMHPIKPLIDSFIHTQSPFRNLAAQCLNFPNSSPRPLNH